MSHRIIIMNSRTAAPSAAAAVEETGVESLRVEYIPDHGRTEAQIGQDIAKILRLTKKIEAVGTPGEPADA